MPLSALLWILVIAAGVSIGSILIAVLRNKGDAIGDELTQLTILGGLVVVLAAPNLLWYKSVRDVMLVDLPAPLEQSVEKPAPATVEAPAVFHPELMVQ